MVKIDQEYYAVKDVNGMLLKGRGSSTNGLYSSESKALSHINKNIKFYERWLEQAKGRLEKATDRQEKINYYKQIQNYNAVLWELRSHKLIKIKVVEVGT